MLNFLFPFPPLAEQHRIVAKVDQRMTLCDDLGVRLTAAHAKAEKMASSAAQTLLGGVTYFLRIDDLDFS